MGKERPRGGYGFSNAGKELARKRAGGLCEQIDCTRKNTNQVNHFEAIYIAKLDNKLKALIRDPELNSLMLCAIHQRLLDIEQEYQVACLRAEKRGKIVFTIDNYDKRVSIIGQ